jgi:PIN domain nuclease of toxin-antitoxin system
MKLLLDTQHLLWLFIDPRKISNRCTEMIENENNSVFYSQVSLWEISIKYNLGKLVLNGGEPEDFYLAVENSFLICKKIESIELITSHNLPLIHRDPFDRLLIWQAIREKFIFVTSDKEILNYQKFGLILS